MYLQPICLRKLSCFTFSTPSAITSIPSSFAILIIVDTTLAAFSEPSISSIRVLSILSIPKGSSLRVLRDEYPVPKSSICILNPYSQSLSIVSFILTGLSIYALSVISILNLSGATSYFVTRPTSTSYKLSNRKSALDILIDNGITVLPSSFILLSILQASSHTNLSSLVIR